MWERLIRRQDRVQLGIGLEYIENPFFAEVHVRRLLDAYTPTQGLSDLKAEFGCAGRDRHNIPASAVREMLEAVGRGDWLLVLDQPFSPLSRDVANHWSSITGKYTLESYYYPPPVQKPMQSRADFEEVPRPVPAAKQWFCSFTKPRTLADGAINYSDFGGPIPAAAVGEYGTFALLGGRETDAAGNVVLQKVWGGALPSALGSLRLGGVAATAGLSCGGLCTVGATAAGGVAASALATLVGVLWPSSLGDSSLYTEEQLKSLKHGRTRVRLHVEQQADGTLKGYGYNTQQRPDWEMIPVVQFQARGAQQVADFGDGVTLIWTPAVDPSSAAGIPPLEGAPKAPQIWIYPPTERADNLIVSPLYPPEYKDFILVFPAGSGVKPLYIVVNVRLDPGTVTGQGEEVSGIWLAGAGAGLGVPIPPRVADQLRGKRFSTFNAFRKAFWIAVANDQTLSSQFVPKNIKRMQEGYAPTARHADAVGQRKVFELHHVEWISEGGKVYDVDNLRVNTPKNHIDNHR
ncbi:hypothetical protein QF043_001469 [Pseudomonas sp. W3I7]|uniref:S-type pyocin domain-containing protein n=1 Tax=Pseudomonas sp. W3I7 TaxID=3042292 RepID=UPI00278D7354|nr:S-type pyocin domain-containing protein [Pseudomonas sp. W3I7]MDQ0702677.1 hypothetical protein [Pseudomonas sp. W3I7]